MVSLFSKEGREFNNALSRYMRRVNDSQPRAHIGRVLSFTSDDLVIRITDIVENDIIIKASEGLLIVQDGVIFEVDEDIILLPVTSRFLVVKLFVSLPWIQLATDSLITDARMMTATDVDLSELSIYDEIKVEGVYTGNRFSHTFSYLELDAVNAITTSPFDLLNASNRGVYFPSYANNGLSYVAYGKTSTKLSIAVGRDVASGEFTYRVYGRR